MIEGLFFLIIICFIIVISIRKDKINENLNDRGVLTEATIISQRKAVEYTDYCTVIGTFYTIQFYDANKKMYQGTFLDDYSDLYSEGEKIKIIYDPSNPKHFCPYWKIKR